MIFRIFNISQGFNFAFGKYYFSNHCAVPLLNYIDNDVFCFQYNVSLVCTFIGANNRNYGYTSAVFTVKLTQDQVFKQLALTEEINFML